MHRLAVVGMVVSCLTLAACQRGLENDVYTSQATLGKVLYGTITSVRAVTVKDKDTLAQNTTGGLAGAAAGGVAGANVGKGNGSAAAAVGGAIAGAVIGALVEDQLSTQRGMEYIVLLDKASSTPKKRSEKLVVGDSKSVSSDIEQAVEMDDASTRTISVIQSPENPVVAGQRVMVIFHDDRPRVVAVP